MKIYQGQFQSFQLDNWQIQALRKGKATGTECHPGATEEKVRKDTD